MPQFLSETNGEMYHWLHNYVADHPLPNFADRTTPEEWLSELASSPLAKVRSPGQASFVSPVTAEAALGEREVSPR